MSSTWDQIFDVLPNVVGMIIVMLALAGSAFGLIKIFLDFVEWVLKKRSAKRAGNVTPSQLEAGEADARARSNSWAIAQAADEGAGNPVLQTEPVEEQVEQKPKHAVWT